MRKIMTALFILIAVAGCSFAEKIVFEGTPQYRCSTSFDKDVRDKIVGEDQINYKVLITKDENGYLWSSREKRSLNHNLSGIYQYFVNPQGSGYIKLVKNEDGSYSYMEHMTSGLQTITYWGNGNKLDL